GVRIGRRAAGERGMIGSAAHRLMVYARGNAAALAWDPVASIVIGERSNAVLPSELRNKGPVGEMIGEQNCVQRLQRLGGKGHVLPGGSGWRGAIIEGHSQGLKICSNRQGCRAAGLEQNFLSFPVRAARRLARMLSQRRGCGINRVAQRLGAVS